MLHCNICRTLLGQPIYTSANHVSIDSQGKLFEGDTKVFFCEACGHLQTQELEDVAKYYSEEYNFLIEEEEEDQLYQVVNGQKIFRTDHQLTSLQEKIQFLQGARVLDYGCGKGAMLRRLHFMRPDIIPHSFDVSEVYVPFWKKFIQPDNWAVYTPKPEWTGYFDVILSFFALEHITNPKQVLEIIVGLLKPQGYFYFVVPNVYGIYLADLLVIDHVNHFSEHSIRQMLNGTGLQFVEIDSHSHDTAFIVVAQKTGATLPSNLISKSSDLSSLKSRALEISQFWKDVPGRVQEFETQYLDSGNSAIYGAGVCGSFIASQLKDSSKIQCFVDQNPYKQRQGMLGKPVIPPERLDMNISTIYVGLNPQAGRRAIAGVEAWKTREHHYFYL